MKTPETLEEALAIITAFYEENKGYQRQLSRLRASEEALKEQVDSYEAMADEMDEDTLIYSTVERIEMDRTAVEAEFQLGYIPSQARDIFMEHTDKYLKMLNG